MPKLKVKTKGNSNPRGKSRVYFCCHHDDYGRYFDEISFEIMKNQNCAFYYDSEPLGEVNEEEWLSYLSEMQLFVIPVTTRLLTSESRALSLEFRFAEEKHIPVLPLMQENGLEELFKEKIGSLQYLNKYKKDDTAISYEEKLDRYLNSVLIGDELSARVRAAFDAYIFLSYRKKDRVYAQELMRLIHKNDFCRDIAIWYDEFLTPGENFNDSIEEALKKSRLFTLAVTPNLVNEENYVMNVEYPMARKQGKAILPVEVVETDKNELRQKYKDIPVCANAYNESELSSALFNSLRSIALRENDNDPQHNFFIGLAYLSGIDVEVNHERAVELITSAAEAGLAEAMEKLAFMYTNGEGVERNYKKAVIWFQKNVTVHKNIWLCEKTEENACNLCSALKTASVFAECIGVNGNSIALDNYTQMHELCKEAFGQFGYASIRLRLHYLESCIYIGRKYFLWQSNYIKAKTFYQSAFDFMYEVRENLTIAEKLLITDGCVDIAQILIGEGDSDGAKSKLQKALNVYKAVERETGEVLNNKISHIYLNLGEISDKQNDLTAAADFFVKAVKLSEKMLPEEDASAMVILYTSYDSLASIAMKKKRNDIADAFFKKSIEVRKKSDEVLESYHTKEAVANGYKHSGKFYEIDGRMSEAKEAYLNELKIRICINEKYKSLDTMENLILAQCSVARMYLQEGNTAKADTVLRDVSVGMDEINASSDVLLAVCSVHLKMASVYGTQGCEKGETEHVEKADALSGYIDAEYEADKSKRNLIKIYEELADCYWKLGKTQKASYWYLMSIKLLNNISKDSGFSEDFDSMATIWCKLARTGTSLDKRCLEKAYDIWRQLSEAYPENSDYAYRRDAALDCMK